MLWKRLKKSDAQVVLIISGRRNSCQDDTVATAVRGVADEVAAYAIPQTGASDLLIASKRDKKSLYCHLIMTVQTAHWPIIISNWHW